MCPTTVMPLHVCSIGKGSWRFRVVQRQTSTSPITLDHSRLLVNVISSNNQFNCEWIHFRFHDMLLPALIMEISISGRRVNWSGHPNHATVCKFLQLQILLPDEKFDGLQKLCLTNYTRCTACLNKLLDLLFHAHIKSFWCSFFIDVEC